ncbi:MAG: flavin reductase family protein [Gammaproteobacteria bacterium]|nr:flavin reductase family protein [Gammaproteobacteria bacterium]
MDQMKKFRQCLGKFTTGVTIVTCTAADGERCGITANSFSSVSLEPPLILWNIAKVSRSLQAYLDASQFAVNILAAGQQALSNRFAKSEANLFDGVEHEMSEYGVPLIPDTLACLECRTGQIHDCGDHYIIIGEVERFRASEAEPLVFSNGAYASLAR